MQDRERSACKRVVRQAIFNCLGSATTTWLGENWSLETVESTLLRTRRASKTLQMVTPLLDII